MNDTLNALLEDIEIAESELEELTECGDLEDRLDAALRLSDLQAELHQLRKKYDES